MLCEQRCGRSHGRMVACYLQEADASGASGRVVRGSPMSSPAGWAGQAAVVWCLTEHSSSSRCLARTQGAAASANAAAEAVPEKVSGRVLNVVMCLVPWFLESCGVLSLAKAGQAHALQFAAARVVCLIT